MPTATTPTAPGPVLARSLKSYAAEYASSMRNSRVATRYHPLARLSWVRAHEPAPSSLDPGEAYPALMVTIDPAAEHVGVLFPLSFSIYSRQGGTLKALRSAHRITRIQGSLQMLEWGYFYGTGHSTWDGGWNETANRIGMSVLPGIVWGVLMDLPHYVCLVASPTTFNGPHSSPESTPPSVWVDSNHVDRGSRTPHDQIPGTACGVIAPDGRTAMAFRSGRFVVVDAYRLEPGSDLKAARLVDVPIDFQPYDMSVVESGYAILADGGPLPNPAPRTGVEREIAWHARRIEFRGEGPAPRWKTVVHHLGLDGRETWRHAVPFEVLQPPIDGGGGRIYLMGNGTAAIQDGRLLFVTPSPTPMFGTAFQDGTLVISAGAELRIVGPDGVVRQTFTTTDREPITTPPAIGSDGSVWIGTAKGLYVAM